MCVAISRWESVNVGNDMLLESLAAVAPLKQIRPILGWGVKQGTEVVRIASSAIAASRLPTVSPRRYVPQANPVIDQGWVTRPGRPYWMFAPRSSSLCARSANSTRTARNR